eukprot:CAMPEP_0170554194 /NCGR_PEP_ID=MMETSP0211-20121228/12068_1 /TAXON_ID=311385 /ORGANISM="Pseudokeronopsis sp., Strain OXSARD2" /LENGTH=31 /DNA_ID= /DNA_START= /DNA_END= /DNA_ORIENTATION=
MVLNVLIIKPYLFEAFDNAIDEEFAKAAVST